MQYCYVLKTKLNLAYIKFSKFWQYNTKNFFFSAEKDENLDSIYRALYTLKIKVFLTTSNVPKSNFEKKKGFENIPFVLKCLEMITL